MAARGYVQWLARATLELSENRLATAIGARAAIACVSIFLGYGGDAFARNAFGDMRMREETFEERWR